MPDAVSKPFDAEDLPRLTRWTDIFDDLVAESGRRGAIVSNSQMRRWEYAWLLENSDIKPGLRVLDIGCDHTYFPLALRRLGCEVFAIDRNFNEHIENWYRSEGIACLRADALSLPYPDHFFDRTFSICVGEHIGDTTMRGWAWNSWQEKLIVGLECLLRECVRLTARHGYTAHTFDYYFPSWGARPAGLNPSMAADLYPRVLGVNKVREADFSGISYERSIPADYQKERERAHSTVAMIWKRT